MDVTEHVSESLNERPKGVQVIKDTIPSLSTRGRVSTVVEYAIGNEVSDKNDTIVEAGIYAYDILSGQDTDDTGVELEPNRSGNHTIRQMQTRLTILDMTARSEWTTTPHTMVMEMRTKTRTRARTSTLRGNAVRRQWTRTAKQPDWFKTRGPSPLPTP